MFGRSAHLNNLNHRLRNGSQFTPAQEQRISEMRSPNAQLSTEELSFLEDLTGKELVTAERRRRHQDRIAGNQVKAKAASKQELSKEETQLLDTLIKHEQKLERDATVRSALRNVAGATALGGGISVGMAALGNQLSPFSTDLSKEGAELAAQQFRIEEEMGKRAHQDTIAQRTAVQEADLQQDLRAMEEKMRLESQLSNALKQESIQGPNAFDVQGQVNQLAADFMSQGLEPNQAISKAIEVTSMQGRNQGFL